MSNGINKVDRGTITFLEDSVSFARVAEQEIDSDWGNSLARASILSTVFFVEACANACLDMLPLDNQFAADVDRLPLVSKFELYAKLAYPKRPLKRSQHEVRGLVELKQVRDSFVHPKKQKVIWETWSPDGGKSHSPKTKAVALPKIASYCSPGDDINAMKTAHRFLLYFFRDICRLNPTRVSAIILSDDPVPNLLEPHFAYWPASLRVWIKNYGVDLSYMRIGTF